MKKTVFTLFAALLVLLIASCDLFEPPAGTEVNSPNPTDDGREMVRLTISVGGSGTSRALSQGQASTGTYAVNIYEVVFMDDIGNVYRKNWTSGTPGPIPLDVAVGDYTGVGKAVVFAGYQNGGDNTLLAVGTITQIDSTPIAPNVGTVNITKTTNAVTFTLQALNSAVTETSASTFNILGPTSYSTSGYGASAHPTLSIPFFTLPPATHINSVIDNPVSGPGDTSLASGLDTATNTVGQWIFVHAYYKAVKTKGDWKVASAYPTPGTEIGLTDDAVELAVKERWPIPGTGGTIMPSDGKFYFNIVTSDSQFTGLTSTGYGKISITVPVEAIDGKSPYSSAYTNALTWNIRGGVLNDVLDNYIDIDGGAVLLYVGDQWAHLGINAN